MKIGNYLFPYPVLFPRRNDVSGSFGGQVDYETTNDVVKVRSSFVLENNDIEKLILARKALFCIDIVCPKTLFRQSFTNVNPTIECEIPISEMRGKVECALLVVAIENFEYSGKTHHNDFDNEVFSIERGDVLAYANTNVFMIEMSPEEMLQIGSFMRVLKDKNCNAGEIKIDFGPLGAKETIDIKMSPRDFSNYSKTKNVYSSIYHSALVLPALMYALEVLIEDEDEYSEQMWAQIIKERLNMPDLKKIDFVHKNVFKIANQILDHSISKSIDFLENIISSKFNNDE